MTWPFPNPPNEVAVTTVEVTRNGKSVLLACHYPDDGGWAFLHGGPFLTESAQLVSLKSLVDADPSLMVLADLPLGWSARRDAVGEDWNRYLDPDLTENG